jgi:hypothetical protein
VRACAATRRRAVTFSPAAAASVMHLEMSVTYHTRTA